MELKDAKKLIKKIGVKSWLKQVQMLLKSAINYSTQPTLFRGSIITQNTVAELNSAKRKNSKFRAAKSSLTTARFCVITYYERA